MIAGSTIVSLDQSTGFASALSKRHSASSILSRGGCFVNSMHEQKPGIRFTMRIELPYVGQITVKAVTLYLRPGFGYAMQFVDMNEEMAGRLEEALGQLQYRGPVMTNSELATHVQHPHPADGHSVVGFGTGERGRRAPGAGSG